MTSLHSRPPAPERGSTQAPGDRGCSASTGRSGLDRRPEAGATTCGWCQPLQNTTHPRSGERLDKSIALIQRGITRCICASRVTACHSTLFTLRSGHSGLGIYTTQRDAALWASDRQKQMHENQKISTSQSFCDLRFKQQNRGNLRISRLLPGCARVFQQTLKADAHHTKVICAAVVLSSSRKQRIAS